MYSRSCVYANVRYACVYANVLHVCLMRMCTHACLSVNVQPFVRFENVLYACAYANVLCASIADLLRILLFIVPQYGSYDRSYRVSPYMLLHVFLPARSTCILGGFVLYMHTCLCLLH